MVLIGQSAVKISEKSLHRSIYVNYINNQQLMGNTSQSIQNQLEFVQPLEDKHFGTIDIFKTLEGVYIMKLDRNHVKGDLHHSTFKKIIQYVLAQQSRFIIPIVHTNTHQENGLCLAYERASIYTEYYNHTLIDMLNNKKVFEQPQLWFILQTMLQLITELKQNQLGIALDLNNVFLTLKGQPCVSHYHLYSTENTIACYQADMAEMLSKLVIELVLGRTIPEVEIISQSKEIIQSLGKVCSRYKLLGKTVKELLKKEKLEREILDQIEEMEANGKIRKANEIKLTRYKYVIPQNLTQNQQKYHKPLEKFTTHASDNFSRSSQIAETLKKTKDRKPVQQAPSVQPRNQPKRKSSAASKASKEPSQPSAIKDAVNTNNILMSKQSIKLLSQIQKRKQEYQVHMERFKMRKEELMCHSQKENLTASRPIIRQAQTKKNAGKYQVQDQKKKRTQPSHQKAYNSKIR